ncbi:MAG TPA: glutamate racemase [Candidatus Hydrogenedentes bacterium]|nr:glutamate racemase [Candidatus Hydrogenedentota bacterium]
MPVNEPAIGIFDSGVGGLTVLRQIAERLPNESLIYLGDTARVPYGTKSANTVIRYARTCADVLLKEGVKLLVVACNTASAFALERLQADLDVPVVGVIEPGAASALAKTRNRRIGVIGTAGTIGSGAYPAALRARDPNVDVFVQACPLFVPLAEEGWTTGEIPLLIARTYLEPLIRNRADTLVLGCTHYPLLHAVIAQTMGESVAIVDSAEATAEAVAAIVEGMGLGAEADSTAWRRFLVTDAPENFRRIGRQFLGWDTGPVEWVDVQ